MEPKVVVNEETDLTQLDDAALSAAVVEEESSTPPPAGDKPPAKESDSADVTDPAKKGDNVDPAKVKDPGESGNEPKPGDKPEPTLEERLAAAEKRLRDQETFIQRQANEIGSLRKKADPAEAQRIRDEIKEQFYEDPVTATRRMRDLEAAEAAGKRADVLGAIPDFDALVDDIAEVAKADGAPPEVVAAFKRDPYRPSIELLHNLTLRARQAKQDKVRSSEVEALRKELEAEKKKHLDIIKRIDEAAKSGSLLSARSGGSSSAEVHEVNPEAIHELSDAQLEEALAKSK